MFYWFRGQRVRKTGAYRVVLKMKSVFLSASTQKLGSVVLMTVPLNARVSIGGQPDNGFGRRNVLAHRKYLTYELTTTRLRFLLQDPEGHRYLSQYRACDQRRENQCAPYRVYAEGHKVESL